MTSQRRPVQRGQSPAERIKATASAYTGSAVVQDKLAADMRHVVIRALSEDLNLPIVTTYEAEVLPDIVLGDVTTSAIVACNVPARAVMLAKAKGVIAGLNAAALAFQLVEPDSRATFLVDEGAEITEVPTPIARFDGSARSILVAERTALNIIQRLSGIATIARSFARRAAAAGIAIVDTRKTTPGIRTLEKYAVTVGGAANHRYGLFDAILIKDNHIRIAGGVGAAIELARAAQPEMPVEVEVANFLELEEALAHKAEKIMLDNMSPPLIRQAVSVVAGQALIEVSGGINAENLDNYLIPGVDAISIGALTHSVASLDISLEIEV